MKVLVAVHDPEVRLSLGLHLSDWKHQIVEAQACSELVQCLASEKALNLAIIDPAMPGIDIQELRKLPRNKLKTDEHFFIALVPEHGIEKTPQYVASGFDGYLISPVDPYQLKAQVKLAERALKSRHIINVLDKISHGLRRFFFIQGQR